MTMKMIPILMIKNIRSIYATFKIIIFNKLELIRLVKEL